MPRSKSTRAPAEVSDPKTTRPEAIERRDPPQTTAMSIAAAVLHNKTKTPTGVPIRQADGSPAPAKAIRRASRGAEAAKSTKPQVHARTFDAMPDRIDV